MHLVFIFTYGYSLKTWFESGTIEKEIEVYKQLVQEHNFKITFVTYGDDSELEFANLLNKIQIFPIYKYFNYSKFSIIRYVKSFFIPFLMKKTINEVDIIKQNQLMGSWVSIIYKILIKKPLIIRTGYDMLFFSLKEDKGLLKNFLYSLLTNLSLKFSSMYTVTSQADKLFLEERFGTGVEVRVRPNWIYLSSNTLSKNRFDKKILCVGRIEKQKNYLSLIKNLEHSEFDLDIVGTGSLESEIIKLAKDLKVEINLLGSVSNKELLDMYTKYKYFILASHFEGNPKVVLEAMSKGCVPILSDIPNHIELIEHNISGILFDPLKMELTTHLEKLNANIVLWTEISSRAAEKVNKTNSLKTAISNDLLDYKLLASNT